MTTGTSAFGKKREASIAAKRLAKKEAWANVGDSLQTTHAVYLGDARTMSRLAGDTPVQLVVTSPPYWNLKVYPAGSNGAQLGSIDDRAEFLRELRKVWQNCLDRLVPGGRMCVVVGDVCRSRREFGRHLVEPLHAYILTQCQQVGFDPLAPIIWSKIANASTEVGGNGARFLGKPYEPNAVVKNDIEYILLFRKPGEYRHPTPRQRALSFIDKDDFALWFRQIWDDIPGKRCPDHPAAFPPEIARRLIGMFSFVGDTVLDPFWGVGNTTVAAMQMSRSSIGIEVARKYFDAGRQAIGPVPGGAEVHFYEP